MTAMTDRRTFLTAAGVAAVTGLTGCSSAPTAPAATGTTLPAADVPVGGATIMSKGKYVVTQPEAGVFKAFNKNCTHQGCPVSEVLGTDLHCKCHGARFSIADGAVTQGPATKPLTAAKVTVEGDTLRITDS